jgi:alpha-methylacyl-CoA racemase
MCCIESFRPGVMDRLGLGADALMPRQSAPRSTAPSAATGRTLPSPTSAGHDFNYLALPGLAGRHGHVEVASCSRVIQVADIAGGALYPVIGILAALHERTRTGRGRLVDAAMADGVAGLGIMLQAKAFAGARRRCPWGRRARGRCSATGPWRCADGQTLSVAALEPKFWMAFCQAVGRPELGPEGYATGTRRAAVEAELATLFASRTRDEWVEFLAKHDCCIEPVLTLDEARETPHAKARGLFGTHHNAAEGAEFLHLFPNPKLLPGSEPPTAVHPAPRQGEDTRAVLSEAGYSPVEIDALLAAGVVRAAD